MTIQQLNKKLTTELKVFIKKEDLYKTGKLYKSIKFNCIYKNLDLDIKLDAKEYIQYVEKGDLLQKFFALDKTKEILQEFYADNIIEDLFG
jgi:hypothetical protein